VGVVKDIPGIRKYVSVDGGMADNPRPITYGAVYQADVANKMKAPKNEKVTIAGRFCESGDKLIVDITLPSLKAGDLIAVYATGAYNYSMSSNYNRVPRPAMLLVNNGTPTVIIKRETYDDLVGNDVVI
jgi:diaminopimelate decarboxylase